MVDRHVAYALVRAASRLVSMLVSGEKGQATTRVSTRHA